jgi:hypothetical protein
MEMMDIWRNVSESQVIHTFIEPNVKGNLDAIGFGIIPHNVLGRSRKETKKDSALRMVLQAAATFTGGTRPYLTTESP